MNRRTARVGTAVIALAGAVVVWTISTGLFPYHSLNHDEGVYLQQAAMLLEGRLFLHPPVEDLLRPWFFVEDGDRLYSKYAPVPAAMFALGGLLGAYRLALAGIAAGVLALVAAVTAEVTDRPTGLLAAAFVLSSPLFLLDSAVFLPYAPTTLLNLAFALSYLRADRLASRRWAALAGVAIGLAFFSRPYTAVLFAAPFVVHALWTLRADWPGALTRQATTAALGLAGVGVALAYNAVVTGSPWLFPYQAFAPLDGPGFGHRQILGHGADYTVSLALRANRTVVELFFTDWIAGGLLGAALAALGLVVVFRRGPSARELVLAGLAVSVVAGNVPFWGNYNVLGDLDRAGDGLVAVLGPYYHFDLLLPTAAFAAVGALRSASALSRRAHRHLDGRRLAGRRLDSWPARVAVALVVVAGLGAVGVATAGALDDPVERNAVATETYEDAYEPFADGPPARSLVLLPDPYGDWLNHPFQVLRNDPGFDGRAVYAIDDRPFDAVDAFPDRRVYRYGYRGAWAPSAGSPRVARLTRVRDVSGARLRLETDVGVPEGAVGVTVRLSTGDGGAYFVPTTVPETLRIDLRLTERRVRLDGDVRALGNETLRIDGRDTVRLVVFVDYGAGDGFTYRLDLPVEAGPERVRALSPRVERCDRASACGGEATYVPDAAPDGAFVRSRLVAADPNA